MSMKPGATFLLGAMFGALLTGGSIAAAILKKQAVAVAGEKTDAALAPNQLKTNLLMPTQAPKWSSNRKQRLLARD
ncbi:hypothetical protein J1N35_020595 [Gossypium stocksii]|uniref:Uncharacterized protein n=1 Tax=Gossypium stocksii TaxID=47602 RepID=A0A9D3VE94_9ROSI|nr:hypothetical protein J1N35_020595 [Gossypium stocksii]